MSRNELDAIEDESGDTGDTATGTDELRAQVALLEAENERLRNRYAETKRSQYRRTAIGLFGVGAIALAGAYLFPDSRDVLLAIGSIGVFACVLTYYLTPGRFVAASVGERIYAALAANGEAIAADLGLSDTRVYVPTEDATDPVRLFVPLYRDYEIPPADALDQAFVVTERERHRGVSLRPTGIGLYREFEKTLSRPLAEDPAPLAEQLTEALVHQFEIVDDTTVDVGSGRLSVRFSGSAYGDINRFDHPIISFLAAGVALRLSVPVTTEFAPDDRADDLVTLTWPEPPVEQTEDESRS